MSTLAKVFIVFNLILTVVFFGSAATLFMMRYNWREAYQTYKSQTDGLFQTVEETHQQTVTLLRNVQTENDRIKTESAQRAAQVATQTEEIASLKTQIGTKDGLIQQKDQTIESSSKTIQEQQAVITSQDASIDNLKQVEEEALAARNQAVRAQTRLAIDLSKKEQELSETLIAKAEIDAKVEKYEVILANLTARDIDIEKYTQPAIDGVVEAVNQSDRLVVLSVGREQKVEPGFHFAVNRGGEYIGKVQVIEVYDDLSGARITYLKEPNRIQVGDTIVTSSF